MGTMKLYITGPEDGREGVYNLVTEEGESLAGHLCSNIGFAEDDLEARRPERQKKWKERFGEYEVLRVGDDDMTREKLRTLNKEWYEKNKIEETEKNEN